jgi:hypothetical protein
MTSSTDEDSDLETGAKRRLTQNENPEKNGIPPDSPTISSNGHAIAAIAGVEGVGETRVYARRYAMLAMLVHPLGGNNAIFKPNSNSSSSTCLGSCFFPPQMPCNGLVRNPQTNPN